jgi:short subunit fatty acids transporter
MISVGFPASEPNFGLPNHNKARKSTLRGQLPGKSLFHQQHIMTVLVILGLILLHFLFFDPGFPIFQMRRFSLANLMISLINLSRTLCYGPRGSAILKV